MLHRSLLAMPMTSSLISALPMRWLCWNEPLSTAGNGDISVRFCGREVVPQTPTTAAGDVGGSIAPLEVSIPIGTSIAIVFTQKPDTASDAKLFLEASSAAVSTAG